MSNNFSLEKTLFHIVQYFTTAVELESIRDSLVSLLFPGNVFQGTDKSNNFFWDA